MSREIKKRIEELLSTILSRKYDAQITIKFKEGSDNGNNYKSGIIAEQ